MDSHKILCKKLNAEISDGFSALISIAKTFTFDFKHSKSMIPLISSCTYLDKVVSHFSTAAAEAKAAGRTVGLEVSARI